MTRPRRSFVLVAFATVALAATAIGQTPPQQDQTEPKAASSPHQRTTTSTEDTKEAPAATETNPSSASSPHQQQATEGKMASAKSKSEQDRMMNDCMKKEQARNSTMSADQVKKTCTDQMKMHSETKQR